MNDDPCPDTDAHWRSLSHHQRFIRLNAVREAWCRSAVGGGRDRQGRTIRLNGACIVDVPAFYLALGEAVNGPGGYFGACLDSLSDCLCGGFGVLPPLTLRLSRFADVRDALDGQAWCRYAAEQFHRSRAEGDGIGLLVDNGYLGDGSPEAVSRWTALYDAALAGQPVGDGGFGSYFEAIRDVFADHAVAFVPEESG